MRRFSIVLLVAALTLAPFAGVALADGEPTAEEIQKIREEIEELEDRLQNAERHAGTDRTEITGDYRFEVHNIQADIPAHFDGLALQSLLVDTLFYSNQTGGMFPAPGSAETVRTFLNNFINQDADTFVAYQQYLQGLTFDGLKQAVGGFLAAAQQQLEVAGHLREVEIGEARELPVLLLHAQYTLDA